MNDVIAALGVLYDDLAKLQADAKIQKFSDAHPALMVHVIYLMPGNARARRSQIQAGASQGKPGTWRASAKP